MAKMTNRKTLEMLWHMRARNLRNGCHFVYKLVRMPAP